MFDSISSKTRRRLAFAGMMSCLFAAGLAFAAFENGSVSKPVSPAGIPQIETSATALDPRDNPDDCLYVPPVPKAMTAVPGNPDDAGSPTTAKSTDAPGDDDAASAVSPGNPSGGASDSPSDDASDLPSDDAAGGHPGDDAPAAKSPHQRDTESSCPGL